MKKNDDHAPEGVRPESLVMGHGYRPGEAAGSLKVPLYQTSTFEFESAEEGKAFFEVAFGLREPEPGEKAGYVYSRYGNPTLEVLEARLALWDEAEAGAVFASGMAAISTTLLAFLRPGDVLLHSEPLYGGTDFLINQVIPRFGIRPAGFLAGTGPEAMEEALEASGAADRLGMIFVETPSNPNNALVDISLCADLARRRSTKERRVLTAVDNTFLGPVWQHPVRHGADLVVYSATKYIGGHSDLVAGACFGPRELLDEVRTVRGAIGTTVGPHTAWLLLRSLETLQLRMARQTENAQRVAELLDGHPKVEKLYYLGQMTEADPEYPIYRKQCLSPGAMLAFDIRGGEAEAFRFLNSLRLFRIAVSLGSTESLAQHPAAMTHADVPFEARQRMGVTERMVRLSIGVEDPDDLVRDVEQALEKV
jgi:methionine-gamma-lyase